jgi:hypothetical protein
MARLLFPAIIFLILPAPASAADDKRDNAKAEEFKALNSEWTVAKATLAVSLSSYLACDPLDITFHRL